MMEQMSHTGPDDPRQSNRTLLFKLGFVVVVMFGFGFLLVPFYDQICKLTGLRDIDNPDRLENSQIARARCGWSSTPTCANCRGRFDRWHRSSACIPGSWRRSYTRLKTEPSGR